MKQPLTGLGHTTTCIHRLRVGRATHFDTPPQFQQVRYTETPLI